MALLPHITALDRRGTLLGGGGSHQGKHGIYPGEPYSGPFTGCCADNSGDTASNLGAGPESP